MAAVETTTNQTMETQDQAMKNFVASVLRGYSPEQHRYVSTTNELSRYPEAQALIHSIYEEIMEPSDLSLGRSELAILAGVSLHLRNAFHNTNVTIVCEGESDPQRGNWIWEDHIDDLAKVLFCAAVNKLRSMVPTPENNVRTRMADSRKKTQSKIAKVTQSKRK